MWEVKHGYHNIPTRYIPDSSGYIYHCPAVLFSSAVLVF